MSSSNTNNSDNNKILYQLWTDGKGSFAVRKEEEIEENSQFEYSDSNQQIYSKIIDSKILYNGSITQELVKDWIEELKEANILDQNGNLIYVEF
jgi:hypothetical protein